MSKFELPYEAKMVMYDKIVFCGLKSILVRMNTLDSTLAAISWADFTDAKKQMNLLKGTDRKIAQASLSFRSQLQELMKTKKWERAVGLIAHPSAHTPTLIVNSGRLALLTELERNAEEDMATKLKKLPPAKPTKDEIKKRRVMQNAKRKKRAEYEEEVTVASFRGGAENDDMNDL